MNNKKDHLQRHKRHAGSRKLVCLLLVVLMVVSTITPAMAFGEDTAGETAGVSTEVTSVQMAPTETEAGVMSEQEAGEQAKELLLSAFDANLVSVNSNGDLVVKDAVTGVTVTIPESSMPEGVEQKDIGLTVRELTDEEFAEFSDEVHSSENRINWVYDITLIHKVTNEELQPSGTVAVTVGEAIDEDSKVVRIEDEGGYTELQAVSNGSDTVFETEHFSRYGSIITTTGKINYFGWTYTETEQFQFAYYYYQYTELKAATAFCIQKNKVFQNSDTYTIYYDVDGKDLEDLSTHGNSVTISEDDFMKLKRMMYLYETQYKDFEGMSQEELDAYNFYLRVNWGSSSQLRLSTWYGSSASGSGGWQAIQLKHWAMFQAIIHKCLESGFTEQSVLDGRRIGDGDQDGEDTGNNPGKEFRQKYWAAAIDSSKDAEINSKYEFLIGESKSDSNQNVVIIKEKDSRITTTVNADGKNSTSGIALPLSIENLTKSGNGNKVLVPVKDTVYYYELENTAYNITGHLYKVKADGTVDESAPIKTVTQTNVTLSGDGSLVMDFGTIELDPNERYVVYETVETVDTSAGNYKKFEHKQSNDNAQSFTISEINTTLSANNAAATSGSPVSVKATDAANGVKVVDTIRYENLPVGKAYNIAAELYEVQYNESTGSYVPSGSAVAHANVYNYTISSKNGSIPVDFGTLTNLQEGKRYVCYQTMTSVDNLIDSNGDGTLDTKHVITHKDANDNEQTVRITENNETEFSVGKTWDENVEKKTVKVRLLDNGQPYYIDGKIAEVELSEDNHWYYKWEGLPKNGHNYTAIEVLDGTEDFKPEYPGLGTFSYTITTTTDPDPIVTYEDRWVPYTGSDFSNGDELIIVENSSNKAINRSTNNGPAGATNAPSTDSNGYATNVSNDTVWVVANSGSGELNLYSKANSSTYLYMSAAQLRLGSGTGRFKISNSIIQALNTDYNSFYYLNINSGQNGFTANRNNTAKTFTIYKKTRVEVETPGTTPGTTTETVTKTGVYLVNNVPKPDTPGTTTDLAVKKNWEDGLTKVPVEVKLYRNGVEVGSVWLNEDNGWAYVWTGLEGERSEYTVQEVIPEGAVYEASVVTNPSGSVTVPSFHYDYWAKSNYQPGDSVATIGTDDPILLVTEDGYAWKPTLSGAISAQWNDVRLTNSAIVTGGAVDADHKELNNSLWNVEVDTDTNSILFYTQSGSYKRYITGTTTLSGSMSGDPTKFVVDSDGTFYRYGDTNKAKIGVSSTGQLAFGSGTPLKITAYCHLVGDTEVVNYTGEVRVINNTKKQKGDLEIIKSDQEDGELLPNVTFDLYKDSNGARGDMVGTKTTDIDGKIVFEDLPYGTYHLVETGVPDEYQLETTDIVFTFDESGVTVIRSAGNASYVERESTDTKFTIYDQKNDQFKIVSAGDTVASWSICINAGFVAPTGNAASSNYELIQNASDTEITDAVLADVGVYVSGAHHVHTFTETQLKQMKRILYWFLTEGENYSNAYTVLTAMMRIATDGSYVLYETHENDNGYRQCYAAMTNEDAATDALIAKTLRIDLFKTETKSGGRSMQNMLTAKIVEDNSVNYLSVTNKKKDKPSFTLPDAGGVGMQLLLRIGFMIAVAAVCVYLWKRRYTIRRRLI